MFSHLYKPAVCLLLTTLLLSCGSDVCGDIAGEVPAESRDANSVLNIRTMAAEAEGGTAGDSRTSYPIAIYVFDSADRCAAVQTIAGESGAVSLRLPEGVYSVSAVAGANAADYTLPARETATRTSAVTLLDGSAHSDLMTAQSTVSLTYGGTNTLTLSLRRKVMLLEDVTINNVPNSVTAVSVTLLPLYTALCLDGTYTGDNGAETIQLTKEGETGTWKSAGSRYILPPSGAATVQVSFTAGGTAYSYTYNTPDRLEANYRLSVTGTYTGTGVAMSGTVTGASWAGTKDITFNFDEDGGVTAGAPAEGGDNTGEGGGTQGGGTVTGTVPAAGTLYNGCYVLRSETSGATTTVTLMSTGSRSSLRFTPSDNASIQSAIDAGIASLATEGIPGWRPATKAEMDYIRTHIETINTSLSGLGKEEVNKGNSYTHYMKLDNGGFGLYSVSYGSIGQILHDDNQYAILRAFTTVTFTAE